MAHIRSLLSIVASLSLAACGSMADFDPPATPPPPSMPAAPVAPAAEPPEAVAPPPAQAAEFDDTDPAALTDFKEHLDPYGVWVDDPIYGRVWVPAKTHVGADFAPYVSAGHWALDGNGDWLWVSDYDDSFGWVVFHYGRWVWASGNGWVWIPGRRYAPAWVVWRTGDPGYGYVGWAPMPPAYYWGAGGVIWLGAYPPAPYVFCSTTYVFHRDVHTFIVERDRVATVAGPTHSYGSPGGPSKHALATPHKGPTASGGHIPGSSWPSSSHVQSANHMRYSTPQGMGRFQPSTTKMPPGGVAPGHTDQANHGTPGHHFTGPAPSGADAAHGAPGHAAPPSHAAPPQRAPSQGAPPSHAAPPARTAPPPSRSAPPPSRSAPPPSRSAPPSHAAPPSRSAPPPSRAAPPSRPSPPSQSSPSRSSPSRTHGRR